MPFDLARKAASTGPDGLVRVAQEAVIGGDRLYTTAAPQPLSRALQKVWVVRFFDPGPGGVRRPPGSPPEPSVGLPGASRRPPGPKTNQSNKPGNLQELTKQWRPREGSIKGGGI